MAWSNAKPIAGSNRIYLSDEVELYEFPANKYVQVRYFGPYFSYSQGWPKIRKQDGTTTRIPKICLDYNPKTETFDDRGCPYRKAGIYMPQRYLSNMIVRELQEDKPRRVREPRGSELKPQRMLGETWRIKNKDSESWTPVRVHDIPSGLAASLANMKELNKHRRNGKTQTYDITDPRYGMDVMVKYNPKAKGPAKWDVQRAEQTRLSRDEMQYLIFDIAHLESIKPESRRNAREEWKRLEKVWIPEEKKKKTSKRGERDTRGGSRDNRGDQRGNRGRRERQRNKNNRKPERSSRRARNYELDDLDDLD